VQHTCVAESVAECVAVCVAVCGIADIIGTEVRCHTLVKRVCCSALQSVL